MAPVRAACRKCAGRRHIRFEPEPLEIRQDARFVLRTRAFAIVVLDAEADTPPMRSGEPPDIDRVHEMAEVEMAGR